MSSSMRRAIVLVLAAACVTLVPPGVAGARVRAKHRAEYRTTVKNLDRVFTIWAQAVDNARQAPIDQANTMMATTDPDLLRLYEQNAMSVYEANLGKPAEWSLSNARMVNAFKAKATRHFVKAAQQRAFKTRCDGLKACADMLILPADTHVSDSFKESGTDPPDYITSAAMIGSADEDAAAGHEGFDKSRAALSAMQQAPAAGRGPARARSPAPRTCPRPPVPGMPQPAAAMASPANRGVHAPPGNHLSGSSEQKEGS